MAGDTVVPPSLTNRPYLKGRQLVYPLFLTISLFVLWGFSYGLLDVLNKHFQNVLKITELESTGLQIVYFGGGYFFFSPIAAELLKRKGYKITILLGLALFALGAIFFQADLILVVYSVISIALSAYTSGGHGHSAVIVLIALYFFVSLMFPTIFVMGTANLGRHTRRGAGILMMEVSGGALFPPIQGAITDAYSTRISFLVPTFGFIVVLTYALVHWIKHVHKVRHTHRTVDVHVVPVAGQKRVSVIISQETVDTIIDIQQKVSHSSQIKDTVDDISVLSITPSVSEPHRSGEINHAVIVTETTEK